ncbi:unnamed protein product [Cylindrotheca closterium]|uniref:Isopenicillin N synthase-like Fe(2+) 2OG dioxygenase domain-containing protein n=1 Tax=Cylindrotheca closterium TaxID=2856 RepID=A0AAD2G7E4_9STRA|nr:unnamed protein product [Cylindrotheca closterium]
MTKDDNNNLHNYTNAKVQSVEFLTCSEIESSPSLLSKQQSLLLHNLQHYGWSPISILVSSGNKNNNDTTKTGWIRPPTKEAVLQVMKEQDPNDTNSNDSRFTYRTAESGGGIAAEPKESLELKRSDVVLTQYSSSSSSSSLVDEWCWAMSEIAQSVTQLLELPSNTLLAGQEEQTKGTTSDNNCLDLLRVFSYHATPDGPQLGSSPHTDWGSWTIVWQDDVGGLETYSREHQQWEPVPTAKSNVSAASSANDTTCTAAEAYYWHCIVHVGDMASLALRKNSSSTTTDNTAPESLLVEAPTTSSSSYYNYYWPSPEHRVQTSTTQKRASLVYFGYPPANTSIRTIRQRLKDWKSYCRGSPLPLSEYYLLQNQSSSLSSSIDGKGATEGQLQEYFEKLETLSIQEVIKEKWKQVQRNH